MHFCIHLECNSFVKHKSHKKMSHSMLSANFLKWHESVVHSKGLNFAPLYPACLFLLGFHICCSPFLLFEENAMLAQSSYLNLLFIYSVINGNVKL
jgi:hypothetical protein